MDGVVAVVLKVVNRGGGGVEVALMVGCLRVLEGDDDDEDDVDDDDDGVFRSCEVLVVICVAFMA